MKKISKRKRSICTVFLSLCVALLSACMDLKNVENLEKLSSDRWITVEMVEGVEMIGTGYLREELERLEAILETKITTEKQLPQMALIEDFPILYQMPQLPTGCEITALTMVLNYYGYEIDKVTMARNYLPVIYNISLHYESDGLLHGNDMNNYFIGSPFSDQGIVCGTGAIIEATNTYLEEQESTMTAMDMTGEELETLYAWIAKEVPVMVWITIGMQNRTPVQGWYTEEGEYVDFAREDHCGVLIGYTENTVILADPVSGIIEYDKERFQQVWESRENRCVILIESS